MLWVRVFIAFILWISSFLFSCSDICSKSSPVLSVHLPYFFLHLLIFRWGYGSKTILLIVFVVFEVCLLLSLWSESSVFVEWHFFLSGSFFVSFFVLDLSKECLLRFLGDRTWSWGRIWTSSIIILSWNIGEINVLTLNIDLFHQVHSVF